MESIFPVAEERDAFWNTVASLLSGHRYDKKFNALTDERSGDNGKSTLLELLTTVFDKMVLSDSKLVCSASFDAGKHSHDASFMPVRGKRILIAEELKAQQTLDSGFLKRVSGGDATRLGGRGFGSADHFEFVWQARIFLVFNQDDCPKFDAKDAAFLARMRVIPMRSKFVPPCDLPVGEGDAFTFPMDMEIKARFPSWRSAMLAIMMDRYPGAKASLARPPPPSTLAWHSSVAHGNNPLSDWLNRHYEVTGAACDVLVLAEVKARYDGRAVLPREFTAVAAAHFKALEGAVYHDMKRCCSSVHGGAVSNRRNVVVGVRARMIIDEGF